MKKKPYRNSITFLAVCISFTTLTTDNAGAVNTQIQTDKTLQGITEFNVDAPGNNQVYTLSEIHGKTAGNNLFYSFSNFNIGATDSAWFNLNTPDLANVISRVTGGSESFIEGALKMTNIGSAPGFFLINSAGITFGSGASVDVPGAFYTSTASTLNMDDGSQYSANEIGISTLSAADPESFGFLGDESGKINIGSLETARTHLTFEPGTDVGFVANQIQIDNATVTNADTSQAGINLQIVASGDEAAQIKLGTLVDGQETVGELNIQNSGIEASGNGSGHLAIQSGNFTASNSNLNVDNTGDISMKGTHGIKVSVQSQLLLDNITLLSNNALGAGGAGPVIVNAGSIVLGDVSEIGSWTFGDGNAGAVTVNAGQLEINGRNAAIQSTIGNESTGDAGNVSVTVAGLLKILDGSVISSDTLGTGNAGAVIVNAGQLEIDGRGRGLGLPTGIVSDSTEPVSGKAGDVTVNVDTLKLVDVGTITSDTRGRGDGGTVSVTVTGLLRILDGSVISSDTFGIGNAGAVIVDAGQLEIDGRGSDLPTGIISDSLSDPPTSDAGSAGDVTVNVIGSLSLTDSRISANSSGSADLGEISINFTDQLLLDQSTISTQANDGNGGAIRVAGGDIIYLRDSAITTSVEGQSGNGGDINITANSIAMNTGFIQANTAAPDAIGGKVRIDGSALVPSSSSLLIGDNTPTKFLPFSGRNIIQAAAPNGESGTISLVILPQLNLSSVLANLAIESFDSNALNRNMCTVDEGSSLFQSGKGGMRMRARDFLLSPMP